LSSMCSNTIFFCTHVFNSHHSTSWIKWLILIFFERLQIKLGPWTFIWLFQTSILMHVEFISKWLFRDGFEHFWNCFHQENSVNGFPRLFQLCSHIAQGHISCWITHSLGVIRLLTRTKPLSGICPIVVRETLYWFTKHILCLQFCDAFATHLFSHQFGVASKGGCEIIIHGIKCTLNLHPN
jgi:hypothetical protein